MVEPWDERRRNDELSEDEQRLLEGLRDVPEGEEVDTVEEQPETGWAVQSDTTLDPSVLNSAEEERDETDGDED